MEAVEEGGGEVVLLALPVFPSLCDVLLKIRGLPPRSATASPLVLEGRLSQK